MTHDPLFLTDAELGELTGRRLRRLQIDALRRMLIPFKINAIGRPVVTRAAVLGINTPRNEPPARWSPGLTA